MPSASAETFDSRPAGAASPLERQQTSASLPKLAPGPCQTFHFTSVFSETIHILPDAARRDSCFLIFPIICARFDLTKAIGCQ